MNNLLIVDDEEALAKLLAGFIQTKTLQVSVCNNAIDALEKLNEIDFDCIVSDLSMPMMNGVEFLKEVRRRENEVPFIIYTGFGSDELVLEASRYGCFEFIEKPLMTGLQEAIKRAIDQNNKMKAQGQNTDDFEDIDALLDELKEK